MYKIKDLRAGDFIDLDNWFREIIEQDYTNILQFYVVLLGRNVESEEEASETIQQFVLEMTEIKSQYVWIFDIPDLPSNSDEVVSTVGDDFRREFAEDYGQWTEIIYMMCKGDVLKAGQVLEMKCSDFLFWAEYLNRKRIVEQIK